MSFDFRNGPLRRKYDGVKWGLRRLEDLLFEQSLLTGPEPGGAARGGKPSAELSAEPSAESSAELCAEPSAKRSRGFEEDEAVAAAAGPALVDEAEFAAIRGRLEAVRRCWGDSLHTSSFRFCNVPFLASCASHSQQPQHPSIHAHRPTQRGRR